ncbi:MAG: AAA family ATPase [Prevotella sp.]|jgi:predicted AAA+ superfamily ATPase|nr:AAA family ATPase [Prevotella sp.]MCI1281080.1 AAA family ATPase [Prevotella sp.]
MTKKIFKRKIYDRLLAWKQEENGESAILIQGPRRVGKSTIAEDFARREYKSYILIDFSKVSGEIKSLFDDLTDLNYIFLRLQTAYKVELHERDSVIIFDEVQLAPKARQAIKHLVKDHRYDYIETGSLISIKKNVKGILIPSEEDKIDMYPMDYEEFRWALGDEVTIPLLRKFFGLKKPLGDAVHRKMMRDFRLYMLVGGMPQAVEKYIETNNLSKVDEVKRRILNLYEDDFRKIDSSGIMSDIFDSIPAQLTSNARRFKAATANDGTRHEVITELIPDMVDSMTIRQALHANDPATGLSMNLDLDAYKLFLCDTGLFVTLAFKDKDVTENIIYNKLLSDKLSANLGYVYENVVAQMLVARGDRLFYHTFPNESGKHNYEIDFLLSRGNKICPIEVKSSGYKTHASLDAFCEKFSSRIGEKYLIYTKDYFRDKDVTYLPVYMTGLI